MPLLIPLGWETVPSSAVKSISQSETGASKGSSDSADQLHSYAAQIRAYTQAINAHDGWELVDIYADEGLTGTQMAEKETIRKEDLLNVPLICSRQVISKERHRNEFAEWFGEDFDKLDIVTTFNLVYNAAIMVEAGAGYAITIDKIANTTESSSLCFRPLWPQLDSGLNVIWKKNQVFSAAAELFLEKLREHFG